MRQGILYESADRDRFHTITVSRLESRTGESVVIHDNLKFVVPTSTNPPNDIGTPGRPGFGVGYLAEAPAGFEALTGVDDPTHANYGNYVYADGSVMVWVPKFYYKMRADNSVDIKPASAYVDTIAANAAGYALHRAFIDGGSEQDGFMVDKYGCSKKAWGTGYIASSVRLGAPLSSNAAHNAISGLTACAGNYEYEFVTAAHARDGVNGAVNASSIFFCCTRFIYSALALLSLAHGQEATTSLHCAWWDPFGATSYPKGNNRDGVYGDVDDEQITYTSDGYTTSGSTSALCGSAVPFARTAHNGQDCGVADLNGNMWEVSLGLTRPGANATATGNSGTNADFYVLKTSVAAKDLTSGHNSGLAAWGQATHLATLYDKITLPVSHLSSYMLFGSGPNQVLSGATAGSGWALTGLGIPMDANGKSLDGANLFGKDGVYEYFRDNLCLRSGGDWSDGSTAGVWAARLSPYRSSSSVNSGFRAACYPV